MKITIHIYLLSEVTSTRKIGFSSTTRNQFEKFEHQGLSFFFFTKFDDFFKVLQTSLVHSILKNHQIFSHKFFWPGLFKIFWIAVAFNSWSFQIPENLNFWYPTHHYIYFTTYSTIKQMLMMTELRINFQPQQRWKFHV